MNRPPLIYIAGPFTGPTAWDIAENVRAAERMGLEVAKAGGMPVIPHANTHLFHGQLTADFWYEGTLALLRACSGIVLLPTWRSSTGSRVEHAEAIRLGLHTFFVENEGALGPFVALCAKGRRLLTCVGCRAPFVSSAYQARYCSARCRNRTTQRSFRERMKAAASAKGAP